MRSRHLEQHRTERIGWLRAAVLGANDGIVSTASLALGVATADGSRPAVLIAGVAGLVAGAMSMAAGEYVSVNSQADTERADLERERRELAAGGPAEQEELAAIYVERGLTPALARQVASELMAKDALAAHTRDELGISAAQRARPVQAALTSAATFAVGAALPLVIVLLAPGARLVPAVAGGRCCAWGVWGGWRRGREVHAHWWARCAWSSGGHSPWASPPPSVPCSAPGSAEATRGCLGGPAGAPVRHFE